MTLAELDHYLKQKRYPLVNSILTMYQGSITLERYYNGFTPDSRNNIKSVWKSILSIVTGICADKGYLNFDDPIAKYLPAFGKGKHRYHKFITIRHLLTMSSGVYWNGGVHYHCPMMTQMLLSGNWIEYLSEAAMADIPGLRFAYKEWDVILLSALIGQATGRLPYEICLKYLYDPLAVQSGTWGLSLCGVNYTVLSGVEEQSDLCARDMAKIGLLMMQNGQWETQGLVSEKYVKEAVSPSAANGGYGFLWWLSKDHFSARGFGGQEINVFGEKQFVSVIQATATQRSKSYGDVAERLFEAL